MLTKATLLAGLKQQLGITPTGAATVESNVTALTQNYETKPCLGANSNSKNNLSWKTSGTQLNRFKIKMFK